MTSPTTPKTIKGFAFPVLALLLAGCGDDSTGPSGPSPIILAVEPSIGTVGTELRLTGLNFRAGATARLGDLTTDDVDVVGDEAFVRVPPGIVVGQAYDLTIRNSDGTDATLEEAFTAVEPILRFVNGATKPSGNPGSTVILEGDAFGDAQGLGQVLFSDGAGGTITSTIVGPDDWTNGFILTTVPSGAESGPVLVQTETGLSEGLPFTVTQNATFSPSTVNWSQTQPLPAALSGHTATRVPIDDALGTTVERVYVVGGSGADAEPSAGMYHNAIEEDGSLMAWSAGSSLANGRAYHAAVPATPFNSKVKGAGYLYVLGGIEEENGGPVQDIARVPLSADGSMGVTDAARSLPVPLHSLGATVFRSYIYVVGGATTGNAPVADAYRAPIDTLGVIGEWEALASLPEARAYHQLVSFGGFLYAVGGETAAISPEDGNWGNNQTKLPTVVHARINLRSGLLSEGWLGSSSTMQKARSKHVALVAGGSLFVSSGLYNAAGNGSSENIYATIHPDGTLGSFNGATGSNTLESVGGVNLFNTRGITYIDGDGVAHVMILGGADVNSPGTKSDDVIRY